MAVVELRNVSKVFDSKIQVVRDVNLKINDSEFVVFVGPSGCGKSTTLRMIAGLEDISSGEIYIDGKLMNDVTPKDRDIAMVFQNYALYPHMTVYENMAFGLKLRKIDNTEIKNRVDEAAKILDLENYLNRKPKALSGGQRQRVAVGRAIVRKPKVFLFDEPLSNLDAKLRVQMRTELSKLHKRLDATMIYVTHDQTEAMTMGDRIVVLKDGVVQQVDTPMQLYCNPINKFVAGFIGSPAMNFISGTIINDDGIKFQSESKTFSCPLNGENYNCFIGANVLLGIRPEHFVGSDNTNSKIEVKIDVVEQMGNEVFLHFTVDNKPCIARLKPNEKFTVGTKMVITVNSEQILLFERDTENRIPAVL